MNRDKLLEVRGLQTHFATETGTVKAVDGIDFDLYRGETVGIVGESGSGKSVAALSLMRLLPEPKGRIVAGQLKLFPDTARETDIAQLPLKATDQIRGRHLAMVFQEPMTSLNPVFTCGEQIREAVQLHRSIGQAAAYRAVIDLLESVDLPDAARIYKAYPHQLSGGQKQRVMIAMALAAEPDILIADEPTTALDVTVQKTILRLIAELKTRINGGVLFITHDLGVIAEVADRVLVMHRGKIVEQGTVADIFDQPKHPYTRGLMACRPPLQHRLRRLPVIADFMKQTSEATDPISQKEVYAQLQWPASDFAARQRQLQSQEPLLTVQDLSTWFVGKRNWLGQPTAYIKAVDQVSFAVYPGETLGLVGESGSGKTTLGRSILRLLAPRSGKIIFDGQHLLDLPEEEMKAMRRQMQIVFQDPYASLNPRKTIGAAILEPILVHRLGTTATDQKDRAIHLLETVGMQASHYYRYPHEFSGGQRQRICIARALAVEPRFIVCDESVSALDVSIQAQVLNLLMDLRAQQQLTYIFISHDLSVVKFMSDRIVVMHDGQIVETGPADEVYHDPQHAYTQQLIAAIPRDRAAR